MKASTPRGVRLAAFVGGVFLAAQSVCLANPQTWIDDMLCLHDNTPTRWNADRFVVRVTRNPRRPEPYKMHEALVLNGQETGAHGFRAYFAFSDQQGHCDINSTLEPLVCMPSSLSYLMDGDVVSIEPRRGEIRVLYRKKARSNALLVSGHCNSRCLMCSQPPHNRRDDFLISEALEVVSLMDLGTPDLVLTGGEPTLLKDQLLELIRRCRSYLPNTAVLLLSNGRLFEYLTYCEALEKISHPSLTIGIPLYPDIANQHDFIVQAKGAFDQTVRGLMNLARCRQRIELRVVIHQTNVARLAELGEFITRNFPFVSHVALMGMEPVGFAKTNLSTLWVDPIEYSEQLKQVVVQLTRHKICTSIYNHQLCTLDSSLWPWARQSISDWKNVFVDECLGCSLQGQCCGFFVSSITLHSRGIKAAVLA